MANKIYNDEYIKDIANAIREKNNTQNTYLVSEMGDAIRSIEVGEGSSDPELIIVDSGVCGESARWELYNDGTLYIRGTGRTYEYYDSYYFANKNNILSVIVEEGITSIEAWLFRRCASIKSVKLSNTITYIGVAAFAECTGITNIVIPQRVTMIDTGSIAMCENLTSVIIGNGVKHIYSAAFDECHSLSSVYFCGTQEEWENVTIDEEYNGYLLNADI